MLDWVVVFFVLALIAGIFGFTGIEVISLDIARTLFFIFLVLFVISLVMRMVSGRRPPM